MVEEWSSLSLNTRYGTLEARFLRFFYLVPIRMVTIEYEVSIDGRMSLG